MRELFEKLKYWIEDHTMELFLIVTPLVEAILATVIMVVILKFALW